MEFFPISIFQLLFTSILSIIVTGFICIHIWLRSTVGKFYSNVSIEFLKFVVKSQEIEYF